MLGPEGGEIVVRASTAQQVEAAAHAVLSMNESRKALQLAYSAMFVHADCDACSTALEAVNTALNS